MYSIQPVPNPVGLRSIERVERTYQFANNILAICGDTRLLWVPNLTDTTTSTSLDRNARTITWDATIASQLTVQASGVSVSFNGTSDEADMPDTANLSFGDSVVDEPFSIIAWVNQTATTGIKAIFSKFDTTGALREYQLVLDAAEKLRFRLYDESTDGYIGRLYNTALAAGGILFVAATYNGNAASSGIKLYSAAAAIDDTDDNSGTYVAMENSVTVGRLYSSGSGTPVEFFSGTGFCTVVVAKELTRDELWALKALGNAYYDLTL